MSSENLTHAPTGEFQDNSYVSRSGNKAELLAVQSDDAKIEELRGADEHQVLAAVEEIALR
jgi:hypothetical protein